MASKPRPIPEGYHTATPYLIVRGAAAALEFYTKASGATDVDAVVQRAVAAGAQVKRPVTDQFYGDRAGTVEDPFGHAWHIHTHTEDLTPEELAKRAKAARGGA